MAANRTMLHSQAALWVSFALWASACTSSTEKAEVLKKSSDQAKTTCTKEGQQCVLDDARLGVCTSPLNAKEEPQCKGTFPCFLCVDQH